MDKIEKLKTYLSKVKKTTDDIAFDIAQNYEKSLPEDLQGLFEYSNYWFNGWKFNCMMTFQDIRMLLSWDNRSEKYQVYFSDTARHHDAIDSPKRLAQELLKRTQQ